MDKFLYKIPLTKVVLSQKGIKPAILKKTNFENSIPYLDISVLESGHVKEYTYKELSNVATNNDVLVVWDGSRSGLAFQGIHGAIGSTIMGLTPVGIHSEFLYFFLKDQFDFVNGNTIGTGIPHVNSEIFFNQLEIPYVDIEEQKAIVKELNNKRKENFILLEKQKKIISNALSLTDINYKEDTDMIKSIQNFRQSILQNAISGELTREWRKKLVESKTKFDKVIRHDYSIQNKNWKIAPEWQFVQLNSVVESFQYGTSKKSLEKGTVPVLRMGNIQDNKISWDNLKYSSDAEDIEKYALKKSDILFNRTNSPELVGKTAIFEDTRNAIFAGYLIRINPTKDINPHFLNLCLNSDYAKDFYKSIIIGSANQANISATRLGTFLIPLPTLEEQKQIVKKVLELTEIATEVQDNYEKALLYFANLEKSILQETFKGTFVDPDSSSEGFANLVKKLEETKKALEHQKKQLNKKQAKIRNIMKKSTEGNLDQIKNYITANYSSKPFSCKDLFLKLEIPESNYENFKDAIFLLSQSKIEDSDYEQFLEPVYNSVDNILMMKIKTT